MICRRCHCCHRYDDKGLRYWPDSEVLNQYEVLVILVMSVLSRDAQNFLRVGRATLVMLLSSNAPRIMLQQS
jgi:hypothetical protein